MMAATKVGKARAEQASRVNDHRRSDREYITELENEIQLLRARIKKMTAEPALPPVVSVWEQIGFRHYKLDGREAGTQVALAERLGVKPYTVNKWVRSGRLITVTTPDDRESVWLDQKRPDRKKKIKSR